MGTRMGQKHADLTGLDPPGGARVLAPDTDRVPALLQETGLVTDFIIISFKERD